MCSLGGRNILRPDFAAGQSYKCLRGCFIQMDDEGDSVEVFFCFHTIAVFWITAQNYGGWGGIIPDFFPMGKIRGKKALFNI